MLGIARALYRATLAADPQDRRLPELEAVGKSLKSVLAAARAHPGTTAHGEAWATAEAATLAVRRLVYDDPIAPLIEATAKLVARPGSMG